VESTQATTGQGELVLRLYDLRREPEMRKARDWFAGEFWPRNHSELEQIVMQWGSQHSRWFSQVLSYWETAATLVVHGALPVGLFYDSSGEAWFCYAKVKPYLNECRSKFSPEFLTNLEKAIEGTAAGRERLQKTLDNIERYRDIIEEKRKQSSSAREAA
jgi:hypothetical protein